MEGVEFEPYPTCLSLPPKAGPHAVMLLGIPSSAGPMRVTGKCNQEGRTEGEGEGASMTRGEGRDPRAIILPGIPPYVDENYW